MLCLVSEGPARVQASPKSPVLTSLYAAILVELLAKLLRS